MVADDAPFERGAWVLVAAAAGGAGSLLVQVARAAGARASDAHAALEGRTTVGRTLLSV